MTATERAPVATLPALARRPVLAVAGAVGALLTALSGRYGYFPDELYFVAAGHHPAWGYADQPPFVPLVAGAIDTLVPGSVVALRVPATLVAMLGVVLAALLARELGGGRGAQLIAAGTYATSPFFLGTGHLLATATFDSLLWMVLTWLLVRWVRTRADGLLLVAGVVTAMALQVKFLVVGFWAVALVAVLLCGPREMLRRPLLWAGGALAVATTVPTLVWQARNGWPQVALSRVVAEQSGYTGGRLAFLPSTLITVGLLVGTVLALHGLWRLLRTPRLRPYRFLGVTALGVTALFLATSGRNYYLAGMFPVLWAVSVVEVEAGRTARWWRWVPTWPVFVLSLAVLLGVLDALPVRPVSSFADRPMQFGDWLRDEIGWPKMMDDVAAAYRALPPDVAATAVVVTGDYWTYSGVQHYAPHLRSYSAHRGAAWFGTPPEDLGAVIYVGPVPPALRAAFGSAQQVGRLDNGLRVNNLVQGAPIWLLQDRTRPWSEIWPQIRYL